MTVENIMPDVKGFMKSRVILTAAELDFFTILDRKPSTAKKLAEAEGIDPRATARVLDCLVGMGFLEKDGGIYSTTPKGVLLSSCHPDTLLPMVCHMNDLWKSWSALTDTVRAGVNRRLRPGGSFSGEELNTFIGAMHAGGLRLSQAIADAYDTNRFNRLLDIGGASGTYTMAFLRKNPRLRAVIFDLEDVVPLSRERIRKAGFSGRVDFAIGDFYKDELPGGCDLALLSAIIHQNSASENLALYRKVYRALEPGGAILIRDHIMDESRTEPLEGALFAINMLVNTQGGDTYTFRDVGDALKKAGFCNIVLLRTGRKMDCLVEAQKPAQKPPD
ncbi:MAG: methyltransferase domain-containing protein [Deltaproteobacteria bacterium]|nr:methyltransferase domain-containing protein [Deltaproteobacteria bacterium]